MQTFFHYIQEIAYHIPNLLITKAHMSVSSEDNQML